MRNLTVSSRAARAKGEARGRAGGDRLRADAHARVERPRGSRLGWQDVARGRRLWRHLDLNAEELRLQAMRAGSHVSQLMAALGRQQGPKIGDLIEQRHQETLRAKIAAERARQARCKPDAAQPQLF